MVSNPARRRNRKGEGGLLRAELIAAATAVLAESADERALSVREVARRAGVSPPAVYLHFADKAALVRAVLESQFAVLADHLTAALRSETDPVSRLRAGCLAYLRFAQKQPASYRMLFGGQDGAAIGHGSGGDQPGAPPTQHQPDATPERDTPDAIAGRAAFGQLAAGVRACQDAGCIRRGDAERDATLIWLGLHGMVSLRQARPDFPWPDAEALLDDLLERLVGLPAPRAE